MTKTQKKLIEREFYKYKENKRNCGNVVNKVAFMSRISDEERVMTSSGNTIENTMVRALNEDIRIHNWVKVFENTLSKFKWEQKDKLMQKRYIERESPERTCHELAISRSTYFYWVEDILQVAFMWAKELKIF